MSNRISYEELLNRTINRVSSSIDTSEGSFLFDAIAPCVAELYEAYLYIDELEKRIFADTAYDEYLERRCAERGIYRKEATCAVRNELYPLSRTLLNLSTLIFEQYVLSVSILLNKLVSLYPND